jgi:hypothetical protein
MVEFWDLYIAYYRIVELFVFITQLLMQARGVEVSPLPFGFQQSVCVCVCVCVRTFSLASPLFPA